MYGAYPYSDVPYTNTPGGLTNFPPTVALNTPADAATITDITPTLAFTGTDTNSDDIEYNLQVDTANTFDSQYVGSPIIGATDNAITINVTALYGAANQQIGQAFQISPSIKLTSTKFNLQKVGSPTGTIVSYVYNTSGTYGTDAKPSGAAIATSDAIDVSTLSTSQTWVSFTFSGANQSILTSGTTYAATAAYIGGDASNNVWVFRDNNATDSGNYVNYVSSWLGSSIYDCGYYIYGVAGTPLLSKLSATPDATFTDVTNGADTHPFASGDQISYNVQAGDALGAGTYYWRVAAIDPHGSGAYGAWSATRSFVLSLSAVGVKIWNGSAWVVKPVKVWNGSAWVVKPVKVWNGSAWVVKG